ncbi:MAG: class I SAM-dependent methyltransferase [Spirochaetia bacterium]|nr:class I SAM-dependent methyltransferase [Spirochaetia bacterium]
MVTENKNRNVWNSHYTKPEAKLKIPDENVVRYFIKYLQNKKNENLKVLDLGCGSGRHLFYLKEIGISAVGLDFSYEALLSLPFKKILSSVDCIPFADNSFDVVLSWGVLHYLSEENAKKSVIEINRILKKEGSFLLTIRSDKDTHLNNVLKKGALKDGSALLYSKEKAEELLSNFSDIRYGFISRIPLGENKLIAHHIFEARK